MQYENSFPWLAKPVFKVQYWLNKALDQTIERFQLQADLPRHEISSASLPSPAPGTKQAGGLLKKN